MSWERKRVNPMTAIDYLELMRLSSSRHHQNYRSNFIRNRFHSAKDLYRFDLLGHYSCVNALDVSKDQELLGSGKCFFRVVFSLNKSVVFGFQIFFRIDFGYLFWFCKTRKF